MSESPQSHDRSPQSDTPSDAPSVGIANWRDVGGLPLAGGLRVRNGQFFRSSAPKDSTFSDTAAMGALNIGPVFDLRTEAERADAPDVLPASAHTVFLDVLADKHMGAATAQMMEFLGSPSAVHEAVGGGKGSTLMEQNYRDFVSLPSAVTAYREMVRILLEDDRPSLVHCTSGKDRTGWATAITLFALGADKQTVMTDYLRTNDLYLPTLADAFARFESAGGDADDLRMVLGVRPEYLDAAIARAEELHGSIKAYLDTLGLDAPARARLRERLTEPAPPRY